MQEALFSLIEGLQITGGLITFIDGHSAPDADPTLTDMGATVLKAHAAPEKEGVEIGLDKVDYSSKEADEC